MPIKECVMRHLSAEEIKNRLSVYEQATIRNKNRYEMFDGGSYRQVLDLIERLEQYAVVFRAKYSRSYIYYDTPTKDLEKSGIALYRSHLNKVSRLIMCRASFGSGQGNVALKNIKKSIIIPDRTDLKKHMPWMIDAFKDMFVTPVSFDPEYLLNRLTRVYEIHCEAREYTSMNGLGLKVKLVFDSDKYINHHTKRSATGEIVTFYHISNESTDTDYKMFVSKLERYCKELSLTQDHKTDILMYKTKLTSK